MKPKRFKFLLQFFLIPCLLLPVLLGARIATQAAVLSAAPPSFADGNWAGAFSASGREHNNGMEWHGWFSGDMTFIATGGLIDGTWKAKGLSAASGEDVKAAADYVADGFVVGASDYPSMALNQMTLEIEADVSGYTMNDTMTFGPEEGQSLEIVLVSATCNQVVGDFVTSLSEHFAEYGSENPYLNGSFSATRVGNLSAEDLTNYNAEVGELITEAQELKIAAEETGSLDWGAFNLLTVKAEYLMAGLAKGEDCGLADAAAYQSVISDVVADIYFFAVENPNTFPTGALSRLTYLGVRLGVTGSGAPNQVQAESLESNMVDILTSRLLAAIENQDAQEITDIFVAQGPLGNPELAAKAAAAYNSLP